MDYPSLVVVSVNSKPLLLIFFLVLLCKLVRHFLSSLTSLAVRIVTPYPDEVKRIRNDLYLLKKEISNVAITDDFPTYSRLKRKQVAMEKELGAIEGDYRSDILRKQALLELLTTILLEITPIIVIIYWRTVPIIVMNPDLFWPLTPLVQFPTHVSGGVGSPIWALCCRQTLQAVSSLFITK